MPFWRVILNPWAGRGRALHHHDDLAQMLRNAHLSFDIVMTQARGDAFTLAQAAVANGITHIVAAGGDGTLHEVLNGMLGHATSNIDDHVLGILPLGSGNDFIKSLGVGEYRTIGSAVQRLVHMQTRRIDVGYVIAHGESRTYRAYLLNALGMGVDAWVGREHTNMRRLHGTTAYFVAVVRALWRYRAASLHLQIDERSVSRRLLLATVANGRCQGGGFWLTPDAQLDDGMLDLCLIETLRPDQLLRHFVRLFHGSHIHLPFVLMERGRTISVQCDSPTLVALDGEVLATDVRSLVIETVPARIGVVV